ncbi:MAG: hypothetical protein ACAH80_09785 [Alphaproteobacteria bacterium]
MPASIQDQDSDMEFSAFLESEYDPSTCLMAPGLAEAWLAAEHARIEKTAHGGLAAATRAMKPLQLRKGPA